MRISQKLKIMLKSLLDIKAGEVNTDKAVLLYEGEEDLKEGVEVFVRDGEEIVPAPDGDYVTEDNKTIVVVEGKVAEIKDPEAEVAPEEEEAPAEVEAEEEPVEPIEEPADEPEEEQASVEDRLARLEELIPQVIEGINRIINSLAEIEGRVSEVEGKLAKVEAPAAEPVDEENIEQSEEKRSRLSWLKK